NAMLDNAREVVAAGHGKEFLAHIHHMMDGYDAAAGKNARRESELGYFNGGFQDELFFKAFVSYLKADNTFDLYNFLKFADPLHGRTHLAERPDLVKVALLALEDYFSRVEVQKTAKNGPLLRSKDFYLDWLRKALPSETPATLT